MERSSGNYAPNFIDACFRRGAGAFLTLIRHRTVSTQSSIIVLVLLPQGDGAAQGGQSHSSEDGEDSHFFIFITYNLGENFA
mgnify:FL=1